MSEIKLLPCPFCGGEAEVYNYEATRDIYDSQTLGYVDTEYFEKYGVACTMCNCMMAEYKSEEKAIESWNTRKPMERIVERLEDLYQYNSQQTEIYQNVDNPDAYTRGQKDMYMDRANCYGVAIRTVRNGGKE